MWWRLCLLLNSHRCHTCHCGGVLVFSCTAANATHEERRLLLHCPRYHTWRVSLWWRSCLPVHSHRCHTWRVCHCGSVLVFSCTCSRRCHTCTERVSLSKAIVCPSRAIPSPMLIVVLVCPHCGGVLVFSCTDTEATRGERVIVAASSSSPTQPQMPHVESVSLWWRPRLLLHSDKCHTWRVCHIVVAS